MNIGENDLLVFKAADLIAKADSLVITAGAGMGVDSGLPDFRSANGFWKAYPALAKTGLSFSEIACPATFENNPRLAWGFYGHRLNLYRKTKPHKGFYYLRTIAKHLDQGAFVYTSNVDGQFQKAGYQHNRIVECHGSIHLLQCQSTCAQDIWKSGEFMPEVDEGKCLLTSSFPVCQDCGGVARPNVLMFDDMGWVHWRQQNQKARFNEWRQSVRHPVVVEIGAGGHYAGVRRFGESLNAPLIRINRTQADVERSGDVGLKMGALESITVITRRLTTLGFIKKPPPLSANSLIGLPSPQRG